jgi:hypothetical protein
MLTIASVPKQSSKPPGDLPATKRLNPAGAQKGQRQPGFYFKCRQCVKASYNLSPVDIYECRRFLQVFVNAGEYLQMLAVFVNVCGASRDLLSPK